MSAVLDHLDLPLVLAPLAGGPSTPELTAAVSNAGGLGFLASGYLSAAQTAERLARTRELTGRPFGVNVFVPGAGPSDPTLYTDYLRRLRSEIVATGVEPGEPRYSDDDWAGKLDLLLSHPVDVVSFTFGCPSEQTLETLRSAGSEAWVTVTSVEEAELAVDAGADALVVQGAEAGGHHGSFSDEPGAPVLGLLALLQLIAEAVELPLIATGAIATGAGALAVLAAGASAAQLGTAFMLCPEAGTAAAHRAAIATHRPTALTRAFTGRLARGIRNGFLEQHQDAPVAYPEIHYVTAPLRQVAREQADQENINLWAGETHSLARAEPASAVVARIAAEAGPQLAALRQRRSGPS